MLESVDYPSTQSVQTVETDGFHIDIYTNLMIQVKKYHDTELQEVGVADARIKLLAFYDELPNAEVFQEVSIQCFKERDPQDVAEADSVEKAKKKEVSLSHLS